MGGEQAAGVLTQGKISQLKEEGQVLSQQKIDNLTAEIIASYDREGSPYYSTARIWDDGVIRPEDTRKILGLCIESTRFGRPNNDYGFGLFRM